jgi:hypothetical protein
MRTALNYVLAATLAATLACGGSSGPAGPSANNNNNAAGTMTAQVNGSGWTASVVKRAFLSGGTVLTVQGSDGQNRIITIVVRGTTAGNYSLALGNGLGHNALYTANLGTANWSTALNGGTGTFTITSITATQVRGTFTFTGVSNVAGTAPVQVTSGQFDLPIT